MPDKGSSVLLNRFAQQSCIRMLPTLTPEFPEPTYIYVFCVRTDKLDADLHTPHMVLLMIRPISWSFELISRSKLVVRALASLFHSGNEKKKNYEFENHRSRFPITARGDVVD